MGGLAGQATDAPSVRRTSSDLAAVAARSDEGMWASPTRPRVEPGSAHGIGMPISHASPLFHVVAVATLAAVATFASVATLAAVAAALGCSCGFTLGIRCGFTLGKEKRT